MTFLDLPRNLPQLGDSCRTSVLFDADALSHGAAEGTLHGRASDELFGHYVNEVLAAALALTGGQRRRLTVRYAASTETAAHHLRVAAEAPSNTWLFCRGLDGADRALIAELLQIAEGLEGPRSKSRHAVVLVGQDHAYAPPVRRLRLLGVPTWVLQPGRFIAADLYRSACEVSPLLSLHTP